MNRIHFAAVTITTICALSQAACSSDAPAFKAKTDASTAAGGADSGRAGASGAGGSAAASSTGGASGDGSAPVGKCGGFFGHDAKCIACLETKCCDEGITCATVSDCPLLAKCVRDCDS